MKQRMISLLLCLLLVFSFGIPALAEDPPQTSGEELGQVEETPSLTPEEEFQKQLEENAANMGITVEEYKELLQNTMFQYYKTYMKSITEDYKFDISLEKLYEYTIRALVGVDSEKLEQAFAAAFEALDPNSQFFDAQSFASFTQKLDDSLVGVGIVVSNLEERIVITGFPVEHSPAELAGVRAGDELISVDGRDVRGMNVNEITPFIRGEVGTQVELGLLRDGEEYTVTLTRVEIKQNPVSYQFLDGNILYLKLSSFNEGCAEEVKKVLTEADKRKTEKIIFDLRNNTGGYGSEAYEIASLFLPKGTLIATMEYKDESKNEVHVSTASFKLPKYKTVLLVNELSASASELLAAAFSDNDMGVLIGTQTYGKGTGQQIFPLSAFDGGYKLTVCQYRTPDGTLLPASGLVPDIKVENPMISINKSSDYPQITMERKLYVGDEGEDVKACQLRLAMLGYHPGNQDGVFDQKTAEAVAVFQGDQGLYPCGDLDKATMGVLYVKSATLMVQRDDQLAAAIDYFSE